MPTLSFQQGFNGYTGTVDTSLRQSSPTTSRASATTLLVDGDSPTGTGQDDQVLLRFDGIFGSTKIPFGATITKAVLTLQTTNNGDGAMLHRMIQPWAATDTWATFGSTGHPGGIQAD